MKVSAVIVTRGDVDLEPVLDSIPAEWERVVWNNAGSFMRSPGELEEAHAPDGRTMVLDGGEIWAPVEDLSVYGRYAAIEHASGDLIFTIDDDVIVSDPQAIVDAWKPGHVVCNMPEEFRHDGYTDSALVGFGACFERDLPEQAFQKLDAYVGDRFESPAFVREADTVFTTLTPRILVDVPKTDREFASDPDRLWKQPEHGQMRRRMLELARQVRDA